jgi:hypothetical protein
VIEARWFILALSKVPNRVVVSPHLRTETDPVSETLCFLLFRILNDGHSPETRYFWVLYHRQNPFDSTVCTLHMFFRWKAIETTNKKFLFAFSLKHSSLYCAGGYKFELMAVSFYDKFLKHKQRLDPHYSSNIHHDKSRSGMQSLQLRCILLVYRHLSSFWMYLTVLYAIAYLVDDLCYKTRGCLFDSR